MAYTRTYSATKTFVRKEALKLQIHVALLRSMQPNSLSQASLEGILKGIDNEWIDKLTIFGLDGAKRARAALVLQIDWSRYQIHINAGRTHVAIDERWPEQTAIELAAALRLFSEFCRNNRLRTEWRVGYRAGLDVHAIDRALGFRRAPLINWAGTPEDAMGNPIPELDEMQVQLRMVF